MIKKQDGVEKPLGTEQLNSKGKIYYMYLLYSGAVAMMFVVFIGSFM